MALVFGADVMVSAHDYGDEEPFLHHQLFHVYHQQFFPECDQVWCGLWTEGLGKPCTGRLPCAFKDATG
jgi:hypothetical protein